MLYNTYEPSAKKAQFYRTLLMDFSNILSQTMQNEQTEISRRGVADKAAVVREMKPSIN